MKTICAYCGKEIDRKPCRIKDRNYCNNSHQLVYEYKNGIRSGQKITEKAHESLRKHGHPNRDNTYLVERNPATQSEVREKIRQVKLVVNWMKGRVGSLHHNWQGGKSFEPYPPDFNQQLKDRIRVRDNFICQLCGVPELECDERLSIHHIDYDKENCKENNLISLCGKCNPKVNFNREYWAKYFQKTMQGVN